MRGDWVERAAVVAVCLLVLVQAVLIGAQAPQLLGLG
jgi:hypothetical protein